MNEIETLELAMALFDSTVTERKRRGIYMLELSQRAAKDSSKTRELLGNQKLNDRTFTNSENNGVQNN